MTDLIFIGFIKIFYLADLVIESLVLALLGSLGTQRL
jgi:hypothetical protein